MGRYRERISKTDYVPQGTQKVWSGGAYVFQSTQYLNTPQNAETIFDEIHQGPPYTETGPLYIAKSGYPNDFIQGVGRYIGLDYRPYGLDLFTEYEGGFIPLGYGPSSADPAAMLDVGKEGSPYGPTWGETKSYSSAAYNRFKPKIAKAGVGQLVGEARDTLPMLKTSAKGFAEIWRELGGDATNFGPKLVSDHFLNLQFGWLPFVRDIIQISDVYHNTKKYVHQMKRNNGKWTKVGGTVFSNRLASEIVTTEGTGYVSPGLSPYYYSSEAQTTGNYVTSKTFTQDIDECWFEGRFQQYIQSLGEENDDYHKIINRVHLYGARISPSLVWKVTPWSWLADWFSNAGDVISNAEDASFGLVSSYAATMRHKTFRGVNESTIHLKDGDVQCNWYQEIESKARYGGGPFGFNLEWDDLSPTQLAILTTLGIGRT